MTKSSEKFNFFVPSISFQKGEDNKGNETYVIEGICSTDDEDSDGETLIPAGYDFSPLLKNGFFNWNHQSATKPKSIVGEPTHAEVVQGGRGLYVKGFLYPTREGQDIIELAETLEKYSPNRRLGFSIEGQAIERDPLNKKKVTKARITGVAITQNPKNTNTLMSIVKGEYSDPYVEEEDEDEDDMDKAMMVNPDINPESVEGRGNRKKVLKNLEKSEIYDAILDQFSFENNEQVDRVFELVNIIHSKMKKPEITNETLQKAFSILENDLLKSEKDDLKKEEDQNDDSANQVETEDEDNSASDAAIEKAEDGDDEEGFSDDDMEKADNAVTLVKALVTGDKVVMMNALGSLGVNAKLIEHVCNECVSAASNLNANGGDISPGKISKGEEGNRITLSSTGEVITKATTDIEQVFDRKFDAVGSILKGVVEQLGGLAEGQLLLKGELSNVLSQPVNQRKSLMSTQAIERFNTPELQKGNGGEVVLSQSNAGHIKIIGDKLSHRFDLLKSQGTSDNRLEKAITELDIAKGTNFNNIADHMQAIGISVTE